MANSNKLTTEYTDKQVHIKFYYYVRGKRGSGSVYLSEGLKDLIRERGYSSLDYGFNVLTQDFFIKFTNTEGGISLLDKDKECKTKFTSNKLVKAVLDQVEDIETSIPYELQEVEKHIFTINKEISSEEYVQSHKNLIQWTATEQENSEDKSKGDLWIKFYRQNQRLSGTLSISDKLLEIARKNKMTHIQFGYEREARSVVVKFNNSGEGLSLLNTADEYRTFGIGTHGNLTALNAAGFKVNFSSVYFLAQKDGLIFQVVNSNNNDLDKDLIQWISNEEETEEDLNKPGKHQKNKSELFVRFKNSSFNNTPACNIVLSKAYFDLCVEQQAENMQLGIDPRNNTVYIKLNRDGKGIPLINENPKYKYAGWGISVMFNTINSKQDVLKMKTDYPLEKINDNLFKIVNVDNPLESSNFEDNNVVWLTNKNSYLKIRKSGTDLGKPRETIFFSSPALDLFYNAKEDFMDIGFNLNREIVAIKLTNKDTTFPISKLNQKGQFIVPITSLNLSIKENNLKFEPNREYEIKEISSSLFVVKSDRLERDVIDESNLLWLSQTK
ncbi:hypothetical protein [Priestia aryabhattai]